MTHLQETGTGFLVPVFWYRFLDIIIIIIIIIIIMRNFLKWPKYQNAPQGPLSEQKKRPV